MSVDLSDYRKHLILAEQKAQEDYDKTVLLLSGGALGVSFAFVDKFVSKGAIVQPNLLFLAWSCWGLSLGCVLASFFLSRLALGKAIRQTDDGTIHAMAPGGSWSRALDICNAIAGGMFILGVILIAIFVRLNLGG